MHSLVLATENEFNCVGAPDGQYADPSNCAQYYICKNGTTQGPISCPPNKFYLSSGTNGSCEDKVDCGSRKEQEEIRTSSPSSTSTKPSQPNLFARLIANIQQRFL